MTADSKAIEAMKNLLSLVIEDGLDHTSPDYEEGDGEAPFFSEAYLYNLVGKEDARTILGRLNRLGEALGMTYGELP